MNCSDIIVRYIKHLLWGEEKDIMALNKKIVILISKNIKITSKVFKEEKIRIPNNFSSCKHNSQKQHKRDIYIQKCQYRSSVTIITSFGARKELDNADQTPNKNHKNI